MPAELSTGKSILVCAVVLGCFAVLWPKIFYPMLFGGTGQIQQSRSPEDNFPPHGRGPHYGHPALRRGGLDGEERPRRTIEQELRPGPVPGMRPAMGGPGIQPQPQRQQQGAMGILMPLYTVGIVVFFVYTIMKLLFKKDEGEGMSEPPSRPSQSAHVENLFRDGRRILENEYPRSPQYQVPNAEPREDPSALRINSSSHVKSKDDGENVGDAEVATVDSSPAKRDERKNTKRVTINEEAQEKSDDSDEKSEEEEEEKTPADRVQEDMSGTAKELEQMKTRIEDTEKTLKLILAKLENLQPVPDPRQKDDKVGEDEVQS